MSYTPSYPIPSKRDQAYVLLMLAIGTVKRFHMSLNSFVEFEEKDQDRLLDLGEKIIYGEESNDKFIAEFEKGLRKSVKGLKLEDNCIELINQRLNISKGSSRPTKETKTSVEKETDKKVNKKGILKETDDSIQLRIIIQELVNSLELLEQANPNDGTYNYISAADNARKLVQKYKR